MNTKNEGRTPVYENSYKIAVAREYLTGNLGYQTLGTKYGISHVTVRHFVRWYRKHYAEGIEVQPPDGQSLVLEDEKQICEQLKQANLKIAGLEMLIENAQKELGIDIVKKPGTKQSPR